MNAITETNTANINTAVGVIDSIYADEMIFIGNYDADVVYEIFTNSCQYFYEFGPVKADGTVDVYRGEHED